MAAQLKLTAKDDGLSAVKFLAEEILKAVRRERGEQPPPPARRKSGPHQSTKQFQIDWQATYQREKEYYRATPATLAKWIAEIDENLRLGKTRTGKVITRFEADQISKYRDRLAERLAALKSGKVRRPTIREVREKIVTQFVESGHYGKPRMGQDAGSYIDGKLKTARRAARKATRRK